MLFLSVHAQSAPLVPSVGATGHAGAYSATGGLLPAPGDLAVSLEAIAGLLGLTARGLPFGTRAGDFGNAANLRPLRAMCP